MYDAKLTIGGRECYVTGIEVTCDAFDNMTKVEVQGILKVDNIDNEGINMADCREDGYNEEKSLAKRVYALDTDPADKLLYDYNVIKENGMLTKTGADLLLSILFDEYSDEVVAKLKRLKESESGKKVDED